MKTSTRLALLAAMSLVPAAGAVSTAAAQNGAAACADLELSAEKALGAVGNSTAGTVGYVGLADAPGCTVTFTGTGAVFGGNFQTVASTLATMLTSDGWTNDPNADADGPTGTATGYKKGAQAVAVSVQYDTAKGVCRADQPAASCHPTPAQMNYTITLGLRPAS